MRTGTLREAHPEEGSSQKTQMTIGVRSENLLAALDFFQGKGLLSMSDFNYLVEPSTKRIT